MKKNTTKESKKYSHLNFEEREEIVDFTPAGKQG